MSDYEIGYGRPPKQHRFKPGNQAARSKKGRSRKSSALSMPEIIEKALRTRRTIKRGGELIEMGVAEILVERLVQMMTTGNPRDMTSIVSMLERHTPDLLASAPHKLELSYHRAEGAQVALPPRGLWNTEEDR